MHAAWKRLGMMLLVIALAGCGEAPDGDEGAERAGLDESQGAAADLACGADDPACYEAGELEPPEARVFGFGTSCSPDACLNGGQCVEQWLGYTCDCAPGYAGSRCETVVDNCLPNPCQNGGTCANTTGGAVCSCLAGYVGSHCEAAVDNCLPNPCQNGGTCANTTGGAVCSCLAGYVGSRCQTKWWAW